MGVVDERDEDLLEASKSLARGVFMTVAAFMLRHIVSPEYSTHRFGHHVSPPTSL